MNFCSHCGNKLKENANFCGGCGTQIQQNAPTVPQDQTAGPVRQNPAQTPQAGGSSTVSIERGKSVFQFNLKIKVFIDGKQVLELKNGETKEISVDNGKHFIHCEAFGLSRSETIEFEGRSNRIGFFAKFPTGLEYLDSAITNTSKSSGPILSKISESPSGI